MNRLHRAGIVVATSLVALTVLTGCSSSSSDSTSSAATEAAESSAATDMASPMMSPVLPPVMVDQTATTATAKVGDTIVLNVDKLAGTTIAVDKPELLEVTQAYEADGAQFNPGGKALMPGTAVITVTNPDNTTRAITVTITE
jgi:hypothetical protein